MASSYVLSVDATFRIKVHALFRWLGFFFLIIFLSPQLPVDDLSITFRGIRLQAMVFGGHDLCSSHD
jgi:hypothetical protein